MDVLNLYDIEFVSAQGYAGRAVVQAHDRKEAEALTKTALEDMDYITTPVDMYDIEELESVKEPGILMLGVND
jgi:hypothetical protein